MHIKVATTPYHGKETTWIIGWSGALIQEPYKAVLEQVKKVPKGVYVSHRLSGSPACTSLKQGIWIVEVQGRNVSDMNSFLEAILAHEKEMKEKPEEDNGG